MGRIALLGTMASAAWVAGAAVTARQNIAPVHVPIAAISTDQFESHPAFDPVTGDLYFVRSSPQFQGWRILRSPCTASGRGAAGPASFSGAGVEADPYFTPDGRRLYFISSRPDPPAKTGTDLDIWTVERRPDGNWGPAERLPEPVNSAGAEWFPRLDRAGILYFGSSREGGHGRNDIYAARLEGGSWRVRNLGGEVSTSADDYEFEPAADGSFAILMSDGVLFRIGRENGIWGARTPLFPGQGGFHVGPLLSPSGRTLMFARAQPDLSGELFRMDLTGDRETWPPSCPGAR